VSNDATTGNPRPQIDAGATIPTGIAAIEETASNARDAAMFTRLCWLPEAGIR